MACQSAVSKDCPNRLTNGDECGIILRSLLFCRQVLLLNGCFNKLLGRATTLETSERALGLLEIRSAFFEFSTINFGTLIETGVLDCRRGWNSKRFGKSQMLLSETAGRGVAQGKQPKGLVRRDQGNAKPGAQRSGTLDSAPFLFLLGI